MNIRTWIFLTLGMLLGINASAQETLPVDSPEGQLPAADDTLNDGIVDADTLMFVPDAEMIPLDEDAGDEAYLDPGNPQSPFDDGFSEDETDSGTPEPVPVLELPNPAYRIESIHITGNYATSRDTILRMLGIEEGGELTLDQLESARFKLALGGLFESVEMELHPGTASGTLSIDLHVTERSRLYFNHYYIGSSEKSPFWLGLDVTWLAPFNTDHRFRMAYAATTVNDYMLDLNYLVPSVAGYPISLMFAVNSMHAHEDVFGKGAMPVYPSKMSDLDEYAMLDSLVFDRHGGSIGIGFAPHPYVRLMLRVEYNYLHRDNDEPDLASKLDDYLLNGTTHLTNAEFRMAFDTRSGREMPVKGHFVTIGVRGTFESGISDYNYIRASLAHQSNFELVPHHVLRLHSFGGMLYGDAPFFEKFFFNDFNDLTPSRIHRLNPSHRGVYDLFKTGASSLGYEDFIAYLALSYAWQLIPGKLEIYALVGAAWANSLYPKSLYLGVQPRQEREYFPVDMTFDLGLRLKSDYGFFQFSLGNVANFMR